MMLTTRVIKRYSPSGFTLRCLFQQWDDWIFTGAGGKRWMMRRRRWDNVGFYIIVSVVMLGAAAYFLLHIA